MKRNILCSTFSNNEVTSWPSESWDRADWCEIEPCKSAMEPVTVDIGEYLYESQPLLQKYRLVKLFIVFRYKFAYVQESYQFTKYMSSSSSTLSF